MAKFVKGRVDLVISNVIHIIFLIVWDVDIDTCKTF
jgi:hypothetical protein